VAALLTRARAGGIDGLKAARIMDRYAGRALLAAVVEAERASRTDHAIGAVLGVTGHAVGQRFPPARPRRRGRRPTPTEET
jgi:hypothetical protein